jgi:hypothetical protein
MQMAERRISPMMANEIGAWLWVFADFLFLAALAAALLFRLFMSPWRSAALALPFKHFLPKVRSQMLGKMQHRQKAV